MYHNEYTFHVHAWRLLKNQASDESKPFYELAKKAEYANVEKNQPLYDLKNCGIWEGIARIFLFLIEGVLDMWVKKEEYYEKNFHFFAIVLHHDVILSI